MMRTPERHLHKASVCPRPIIGGMEYSAGCPVLSLARVRLLLVLAGILAGVQVEAADDEKKADDDADGANASLAKTVESWIPFFLGGLLLVAVVGWCSVNLYNASRRPQDENPAAKHQRDLPYKMDLMTVKNGNTRNDVTIAPGQTMLGTRPRPGTAEVSPDYRSTEAGVDPAGRRSSSLRTASLRHGSLRNTNFVDVGGGGQATFMIEAFEGGEVQGKKAPGETGDTYQNPLSKRSGAALKGGRGAGAAEEGRSGSSQSSKKAVMGIGSGAGRSCGSRSHNPLHSSSSHNMASNGRGRTGIVGSSSAVVRAERNESPPHLRPGIAQARRTILMSRDRAPSFPTNNRTYNSGSIV